MNCTEQIICRVNHVWNYLLIDHVQMYNYLLDHVQVRRWNALFVYFIDLN